MTESCEHCNFIFNSEFDRVVHSYECPRCNCGEIFEDKISYTAHLPNCAVAKLVQKEISEPEKVKIQVGNKLTSPANRVQIMGRIGDSWELEDLEDLTTLTENYLSG